MSLTEIEEMQISGELYNQTQDAHRHRLHISSSTFWQFFRFCLVGGANTIIDLLAFNILLRCFSTNNVLVLVACNSMAYASGAVSSFLLNKYWTFRHNKQGMTSRELVPFVISVALQILCSNGLLWLAGKVLQPLIANTTLWANAAKIVSVAVGAVISYIFMRFWVFAGGSQDQPTM